MKHLLVSIFLTTCLSSPLCVIAQEKMQDAGAMSFGGVTEWQVKRLLCPVNCVPAVRAYVHPMLGSKVVYDGLQMHGVWADQCQSPLQVNRQHQTRSQVEQSLRTSLPPGKKWRMDVLGLPAQVETHDITCPDQGGLWGMRILSYEAKRILLLHEQGAVLELRPWP